MVGKILFITEMYSYKKLEVLIVSRLIRFVDFSNQERAGNILGDGILIQNVLPKV